MSKNGGRLRRERLIVDTLVRIGRRDRGPDDSAAEGLAELDAELVRMGQSPTTERELDQVCRAEMTELEARLAGNNALLAETRKLSRHAKAMGVRPGQTLSVVYEALGLEP